MPFATTTVSDDIDEIGEGYARHGVEIRQLGTGTGPTSATTVTEPRFNLTTGEVGFPTVAWRATPDDRLVVAMISASDGRSRWSGVDLEAGTVLLYGPGSEHAATNHPGLQFVFIDVDLAQFEADAAVLGIDAALPQRGVVGVLRSAPKDAVIHRVWRDYLARARRTPGVTAADGDVISRSLIHLLGDAEHIRRVGSERGIDDRCIVHDCITYAEEVDRLPSLGELCLAAHVSERRLRGAFQSVFGLPPSQFFRKWALGEAHRRLSHADGAIGVTEVAVDLGFNHLGRFAQHYAATFDEPPSATLRRSHEVLDEGR